MKRPIEEIKKEIRKRLEGFDIDMVQSDVDSWIFGNRTIAKIKELAEEFDEAVVVEVMCVYHFEGNKKICPTTSINTFQAKRILGDLIKPDGQEYDTLKSILSADSLVEASNDISKLFDELIIPASDPDKQLVKDPDEWIDRVHKLKEKHGMPAFHLMYNAIDRIRSLMWSEGYSEADATVEVMNRQEKIIKMVREFDFNHPGNLVGNHYFTDFHVGMGRGIRINTNKGSGGHGYDISTNGRGHKKVVTGKAGNRYPVAKRKGVR